ncbi:restriction endonuclease [Flavobacterium sp. RNTU_13]|uniref:restriction endonuclease n=1 Tax=Flavobacterium sp. RNTU_13 TaxID=3375145 RepID=UPI0039889BC0
MEIKPDKILFIKLGEGGKYEKDCIEKSQTLRLGYQESNHQTCISNDWTTLHTSFQQLGFNKSVSTSHTNQIRLFYTEDEKTLWITFYANKLWWCFSRPVITQLSDGSKSRPVIGKWSDEDIFGNKLLASNISGRLLKTQGFRGTICKVIERDYTLQKINRKQSKEILEVENALAKLNEKLAILIQNLQWKDFETLVDLIFRQAGWQRVSDTGKNQKTLDIELFAPVTSERSIVQIKSQSTLREYLDYKEDFAPMNDYHRFFFVVHSASNNLANYKDSGDSNIHLYLLEKITELTISSGLTEWVIKKSS